MSVDMKDYIAYQQGYEAGKRDAASPWHRVEDGLPEMSECVVRMELPKNCGECRFRSDGWCYGIRAFDPQPGPLDFDKRPSWCPIICSLPEGHGRLVDADELKAKKYHSDITHENAVAVAEIDWMPTIVPAEAERRKQDAD